MSSLEGRNCFVSYWAICVGLPGKIQELNLNVGYGTNNLVYMYPRYFMRHTHAKVLLVVYLKKNCVFNFAKSGNPSWPKWDSRRPSVIFSAISAGIQTYPCYTCGGPCISFKLFNSLLHKFAVCGVLFVYYALHKMMNKKCWTPSGTHEWV